MSSELETLFRLDGKVVIVTGASGLLGKKHVEAIAAYGGTPVLIDLDQALVEQQADQLRSQYDVPALGLAVDLTNEDDIASSCKVIQDQLGNIYGLVNNAANNPKVEDNSEKNFSRLENFPLDVWNQDIAVGLTGSFLCAKYYGSAIATAGQGGSIVNISSDLGIMAPDQRLYYKAGLSEELQAVKPVTYSAVKAGLIGLTRYLATYWADKDVRCNAICPGGVENGQPEYFLKEVSSRIPLGRLASVDEYQGVLIWMLSNASSYLNGAIIPVDGGRTTW